MNHVTSVFLYYRRYRETYIGKEFRDTNLWSLCCRSRISVYVGFVNLTDLSCHHEFFTNDLFILYHNYY